MQAQLQEQLAAGEEATEEETQYARLRAEKEALTAFREKLAEQLAMIEAAQAQTGGSSDSAGSGEGWVVVGDPQPGGGRPGNE